VSAHVPRIALVVAASVALAGCGSYDSAATASPRGATIAPAASATADVPASFGPPAIQTPDDAAPVVIDSTLLAILPASIGTTPVTEDPDAAAQAVSDPALDQIAAAAQAVSDPALDQIASGVDAAVAVDLGNGDLVYALVVRLKPGTFGDEIYRQWRDSYDEGACAASGGVVGHAEADIGGRKTYVTSCVQGMHTYHVYLADQDVLISASSIGDGRFGEALLQGLRLPA
jgi:hypothetical protein